MESASQLTKLLQPRLLKPLTFALAGLLIYLLAELTWQVVALFREPPLPQVASSSAALPAVTSDSADVNVQALLAVPLFGIKPASENPTADLAAEDVKVSALKIKVLGLVAGGGDAGIAVLQYGGKTRAYAVGEKIEVPGDVKLLAVLSDYVLIENNRRREKLELDKRPQVSGVNASSAPVQSGDENLDIDRPEIRELIGDPRDTVQKSPLKLARFFSVSPVKENGQMVGYSLAPGRDKRLFELLDVKAGDILLSVNGQSLVDASTPELLKMMEETSSFELLVKRGDAILTKRLNL
ncbi:hypothetical protein NCG89_02635 [Spongiibacter taiwanensis]|uniref:type II secretion system protein N n=1 Tax=Spongiibacter taiwanensis TaxID=1748242 RepID=UPI002035C422|nr:type II secretion system protein N [Spongiibacter taiwanensis]USA43691.1 hypothetical protein NCG89_02635 [Spongiibacter taiwanensis]